MRRNYKPEYSNRNAIIRDRVQRNGRLRTETARRDSGSMQVSINTDRRSNATRMSITTDQGLTVRFGGREARTLFRVLARHFDYAGKSFSPLY